MAVGKPRSRRSLLAAELAVAIVAASLVSGRPAAAQYLNAYKAGLDAIEAKDWQRAESSMSEALAERGEEKVKLPVKLFLRPYLPHFYLGYARFERGDCAGALAAWAESERQGVSTRLPDFDLARRGRRTCEERDRERTVAQARSAAQRSLERAAAKGAALLERSRQPQSSGPWSQGDPSPEALHGQGLDLLRQARDAPRRRRRSDGDRARGGSDPRGGPVVRRGRQRAGSAHRGDPAGAAGQGPGHRRARRRGESRVGAAPPTSRPTRERCARRERTSRAWSPKPSGVTAAPKDHLDGLAARLENSIAALAKQAAAPPALLERAADAYLDGRHGEVVEALAGARLGERRARAHARLLLAASRYALYLEGGELDDELRSAAADDARACRQEDETLAPTARFFSPRFVAFFNESAAAPETPSG